MFDYFAPRKTGTLDAIPAGDYCKTTHYAHPGRKNDFTPKVPEVVGTTVKPKQGVGWLGGEYKKDAAASKYKTDESILDQLDLERKRDAWLKEALAYYAS